MFLFKMQHPVLISALKCFIFPEDTYEITEIIYWSLPPVPGTGLLKPLSIPK